jgi:hypothetical protein
MPEPRFAIRVDGELLGVTLPLERAERVALHAVGEHGRHDVAEILEAGEPLLTFIRA